MTSKRLYHFFNYYGNRHPKISKFLKSFLYLQYYYFSMLYPPNLKIEQRPNKLYFEDAAIMDSSDTKYKILLKLFRCIYLRELLNHTSNNQKFLKLIPHSLKCNYSQIRSLLDILYSLKESCFTLFLGKIIKLRIILTTVEFNLPAFSFHQLIAHYRFLIQKD